MYFRTPMNRSDNKKLNRRNILKTTATSISAGRLSIELINRSEAKDKGYLLSQSMIAESHIYYNVGSDQQAGHGDGQRRYAINESTRQMGIIDDSIVESFSNADNFIITDGEVSQLPTAVYGRSTSALTLSQTFSSGSERFLVIESEVQEPEVELKQNDDTILARINNRKITVPPNEIVETNLPEIEVDVIDHEVRSEDGNSSLTSINAEPMIRIKNNGILDVFGKEGYSVVPASSENEYINRFINVNSNKPNSRSVKKDGNKLFIIKRGDN